MSFRLPWLLVARGLLPHLKAVNERKKAWQGALKCRDLSWQHSWSFSRWRGREMWDLQCLGRLGPTYWFLHTEEAVLTSSIWRSTPVFPGSAEQPFPDACSVCRSRITAGGSVAVETQEDRHKARDGCLHSSARGCTGLLWTLCDPVWSPVSQNLHCAFWAASIHFLGCFYISHSSPLAQVFFFFSSFLPNFIKLAFTRAVGALQTTFHCVILNSFVLAYSPRASKSSCSLVHSWNLSAASPPSMMSSVSGHPVACANPALIYTKLLSRTSPSTELGRSCLLALFVCVALFIALFSSLTQVFILLISVFQCFCTFYWPHFLMCDC